MAETSNDIRYKLMGYTPYKSGKGKILFINRYGSNAVVGVACDIEFLNGKNHEKVTEDWVGKEIELKRGYNKKEEAYYVFDVNIKN